MRSFSPSKQDTGVYSRLSQKLSDGVVPRQSKREVPCKADAFRNLNLAGEKDLQAR